MRARTEGLQHFVEAEDGTMTVFSVLMTVTLLAITGAAVDIMHQEAVRAEMQATLDRAVLAAADLEQTQPPASVVEDYVSRAGMAPVLGAVRVDEGLNYRTVTAEARTDLDTVFLRMTGRDRLPVPVLATAEEKVSNVEISLVLDVSGSMGSFGRIQNLRAAAQDFIGTVIQPEGAPGMTTVSVVPYNATVNIGPSLAPYFALEETHDYSHCATFPSQAFGQTAVDPGAVLARLGHFDLFSEDVNATGIRDPWCNPDDMSAMTIHSADTRLLRARIALLGAAGNTAIDLGMKWGVALLDPAMRPAVARLAADGIVADTAAARPAAYDDREAIKFVVVMTDGENTTQYDLKPHYRTGLSDVWVDDRGTADPWDDRFSLLVRDRAGTDDDLYFLDRFENRNHNRRYRSSPDGGSAARRLSNAELFARFGTRAVARRFYTRPYYDGFVSYSGWYDIYYAFEATVGGDDADDRLSRICSAARDAGIVVFAIGFEAPARGQRAMRDCASSASHYFDVSGVEITETFHAIARQINALRLVQ